LTLLFVWTLIMDHLVVFFSSFIVVLAVTPILIKLAKRLNFVDYPSALKIHTKPTPLLGGLAVFISFLFALFLGIKLLNLSFNSDMVGIVAGGSVVVAFGLMDDKKGLSPSHKFLGQIIAAVLFLLLSHNAKILTGSGWDVLILLLWMVGLMNAVNFLDAMDGLCAGISFISASAFLVLAFFNHQTESALLALALMGGLLGFLRYNFSPAKIFLGDAGSMFNGFILACLGILFARANISYSSLLVPILILSYPIFDISFVTLIRLREGRKVYVGDYNNSPRRIAHLGVQTTKVVLWIYLFCFVLGGMGVLVYFFFESPMKMLIAVLVWLILTIFGVHLQRNFVNIKEKLFLIFGDMVLINFAFLFFFWLKFESGLFPNPILVPLSEYVAPALWITIYWLNLFAILGVYEVPGDERLKDKMKGIAKAILGGVIIFLILTLNPSYLALKSWILLLIYGLSLMGLLGMGRGLYIFFIRKLNARGRFLRDAIIVGTKENAQKLLEKISSNPESGYQVVGLVSEEEGYPQQKSSDFKILGSVECLDEIARENKVQDILIALQPDWKGSLQELMDRVSNLEVSFKIVPHLAVLFRGYQTASLATDLLLRIFPSQMRTWEWALKRLFDALISLAVLIVFLPIWILFGFLSKLNFRGFPLVKRGCLGKAGRIIGIYKFKVSKEEPGWEKSSLTSNLPQGIWGRFLRSSGLEKIPLFLNILKGEMSLVGPEPLCPETFEKLSSNLPLLPKRLYVKPGLFSLAKIKGKFKDYVDGAKEYLSYDLSYIENMSFYFDTKIFLTGMALFVKRQFT
jgi:UDP-GlcNAc:undecaprenyl-phosphate GlcNAc-1-phosphate transferase